MRMTETTYMVNTLTGATYDEKAKSRLAVRPMEIKKVIVNGGEMLSFERKKKTGDHDSEDVSIGFVPYAEKKALLTALEASRAKLSRGPSKVETLDDVYKTETFEAHMSISSKAVLVVSFGGEDSTCTFELNANQVSQMISAIKKQ
jgi:hypothetical protein